MLHLRLLYFVTYVLRLSVLVINIHPAFTEWPKCWPCFPAVEKPTLLGNSHIMMGPKYERDHDPWAEDQQDAPLAGTPLQLTAKLEI